MNLTGLNFVLKGLFLKDNPYQTLNTSKFVESSSVSLELKKEDGTHLEVQDLTDDLRIVVPRQLSGNDSVSNNANPKPLKTGVNIDV
jgi:hypothetical protein